MQTIQPNVAEPLRSRVSAGWHTLRATPAFRNSLVMVASQGGVLLLQALQFLFVARALGADQFGHVASATAITAGLLPFSSLGLGNMAIARIARGQATSALCLGNALLVTIVSGGLALALAVAIAATFLDDAHATLLVLLLGTSDILLGKAVDVAAHVYMGLERHMFAACFYNFQLGLRFASAAALPALFAHPTALEWGWLHLGSGALAACVALLVSVRGIGRPRIALRDAIQDARKGVFFSITFSARGVQTDVDKAFLARDASAAVAGAYTAAYRLMHLASVPMYAILLALQARAFRDGHQGGLRGTLASLRPLLWGAFAYGLLVAVVLYAAAPAIPWLLGPTYHLSSGILRGLCLLPLFIMLQSFWTQLLSAADVLCPVGLVHAATAFVTVVLNAALVPADGWMGSAIAAYGSQALLLGSLLLLTVRELRVATTREPRRDGSHED